MCRRDELRRVFIHVANLADQQDDITFWCCTETRHHKQRRRQDRSCFVLIAIHRGRQQLRHSHSSLPKDKRWGGGDALRGASSTRILFRPAQSASQSARGAQESARVGVVPSPSNESPSAFDGARSDVSPCKQETQVLQSLQRHTWVRCMGSGCKNKPASIQRTPGWTPWTHTLGFPDPFPLQAGRLYDRL